MDFECIKMMRRNYYKNAAKKDLEIIIESESISNEELLDHLSDQIEEIQDLHHSIGDEQISEYLKFIQALMNRLKEE